MIMKRTHLQYFVAIGLIACLTSTSWGQTQARRGSNALYGFGQIARTSTSGFGRTGSDFNRFQSDTAASAGNYMGQGQPLNMQSARTSASASRLSMLRQPAANVGAYNSYITPLNISLARTNTPTHRDYTGRESWAKVKSFGAGYYPGQQYMGIEHSKALLQEYAFSAPIRSNQQGGRISDRLSVINLKNTPKILDLSNIDLSLDDKNPPNAIVEIMQNRNDSMDLQNINRAWKAFSKGKNNQSRDLFLASTTSLKPNPISMLGIFLSDATNERIQTSLLDMDRFLQINHYGNLSQDTGDQFNPFSLNIDLSQHFTEPTDENPRPWQEKTLDSLINNYYNIAMTNPDLADKCLAAQAILQWYSGNPIQRDNARITLEKLKRDYRLSPYAQLLDNLKDVEQEPNN